MSDIVVDGETNQDQDFPPVRQDGCQDCLTGKVETCQSCGSGNEAPCASCGCPGRHAGSPRGKLFATNWLEGISDASDHELVEVQFKNTRKGYYRNSSHLDLHLGDIVAVEAAPGHDIGQITMVGKLVDLQIRKANLRPDHEFKKVFRIARPSDLEKFEEAKAREQGYALGR